ncbi:MAG TPA: DUF2807 domain-containing protein [Bacteroidia bacterium]|jgi:hypothetical protein|nr:DUF2807 domain-containing protein [Bacteroidia bacterium]
MKNIKTILLLLSAASVISCHKGPVCDCFESAGLPTEENRTNVLPLFEQVYVQDNINLFVSMGNTQQVIIQGGGNLIHNISATVINNTLTLKNNNNCDWLRSYKKSIINVYVTMPRLTYITNAGVGNVNSLDTITADTLQVQTLSAGDINLNVHSKQILGHLFGSGNLTLNGQSNQFLCTFYSGTGFVYCSNLLTGYTFISNSSTGDCYVNVSNQLDVSINGRGNIYYTGSPLIHSTIKGSGRLLKD